jgi:multiple sugar transport system permease protein
LRGPLFLLFLTTLFIPFPMQMIPLYLFIRDLGLNNSLAGLVVPFLVGGFGIFFMRQAMMSIPDDLVDAARLDGAGDFRIYRTVMLPLCGPALVTLAIIAILWRWNDVLWPLLVNSDRNLYTVTQGLAMAGRSQGTFVGVAMATAAMAIGPVLIAYVIFQRWIIRGVAMTGVKG